MRAELISPSIPRFIDQAGLRSDPLWYLRSARAVGDVVAILEESALFSLSSDCCGTVAAFGPAATQQILSDPDTFGMAVSVAERFSLPPRLVRLNAGLFSMHGERHRTHQHLLMTFLRRSNVAEYGTAILRGWNAFKEDLVHDRDLHLLSEMRRLVLNISGRIVFGNDGVDLGRSIQKYFEDRRDFSKAEAAPCPHDSSSREIRRELVRSGLRLDGMLRARLAELQNGPGAKSAGEPECMFRKLAHLQYDNGTPLSPEDLVAHANILFMSGSEPMAVALTWTLLLLSQQPEVLQNARKEVATVFEGRQPPPYFAEAELPTVRAIVLESLRLLPPNAIMVRLSTRETDILGHRLPRRCEVVLSPYVAHRDQRDWENPDHFDPRRWAGLNPSPYCYLPFGAGNRFCLGKHFATSILVSILARIVRDYDLTLAAEQSIDWKMHINLMPAEDPVIRFSPAGSATRQSKRLQGPVTDLIQGRASPVAAPYRPVRVRALDAK